MGDGQTSIANSQSFAPMPIRENHRQVSTDAFLYQGEPQESMDLVLENARPPIRAGSPPTAESSNPSSSNSIPQADHVLEQALSSEQNNPAFGSRVMPGQTVSNLYGPMQPEDLTQYVNDLNFNPDGWIPPPVPAFDYIDYAPVVATGPPITDQTSSSFQFTDFIRSPSGFPFRPNREQGAITMQELQAPVAIADTGAQKTQEGVQTGPTDLQGGASTGLALRLPTTLQDGTLNPAQKLTLASQQRTWSRTEAIGAALGDSTLGRALSRHLVRCFFQTIHYNHPVSAVT